MTILMVNNYYEHEANIFSLYKRYFKKSKVLRNDPGHDDYDNSILFFFFQIAKLKTYRKCALRCEVFP